MTEIDTFVNDVSKRNFIGFSSLEEVSAFFTDYLAEFYNNNSINDIDTIRAYTGIAFRRFNSVLRGTWNYDTNGLLIDDAKVEYLNLANKLSECIERSSTLPTNIKTYRGVSLERFKDYGITSLEDLNSLENKYYYDSGGIKSLSNPYKAVIVIFLFFIYEILVLWLYFIKNANFKVSLPERFIILT